MPENDSSASQKPVDTARLKKTVAVRFLLVEPYAIIRHPLSLAGLIIYLLSPLALGSFWAILPALPLAFIYIARIRNEEKVLTEKLPGYREHLQRAKYRLIPGMW